MFWLRECKHLRTQGRLRFAGAEHCSRVLQGLLSHLCGRVRAAEHAPHDPFRLLERRHGLAEIVERRTGVVVSQLVSLTYGIGNHKPRQKHYCVRSCLAPHQALDPSTR